MSRGIPAEFLVTGRLWLYGMVALLAVLLGGCASPPSPAVVKPSVPLDAAAGVDADSPLSMQSGVRGMSFEEVQQCAQDKLQLVRDSASAKKQYTQLTADKQALERAGASLEDRRSTVETTDESAVDAYNEAIREHRQAVVSLNTGVDAYNQRAVAVSAQSRAYDLHCANRPFRSTDTDRLPEALRDVWKTDLLRFDDIPVFYADESPVQDMHTGSGGIIISGDR